MVKPAKEHLLKKCLRQCKQTNREKRKLMTCLTGWRQRYQAKKRAGEGAKEADAQDDEAQEDEALDDEDKPTFEY